MPCSMRSGLKPLPLAILLLPLVLPTVLLAVLNSILRETEGSNLLVASDSELLEMLGNG